MPLRQRVRQYERVGGREIVKEVDLSFAMRFLKEDLSCWKYSPLTPMHTHTQTESQHEAWNATL